MNTVEKLAQKFRAEGHKTVGFFTGLDEDIWEVKLYSDGAEWCVSEVLAHIVDTEAVLLPLFENIQQGGAGITNNIDIDEYNAKKVTSMPVMTPRELLKEFISRRKALTEFVERLSEEDLNRVGNHPFLGETTLGEMLRLFYLHVNLHIRDIRAILDE